MLTLYGAISGNGAINKIDSGTLVLGNNQNSYTGGTTLAAGLLQMDFVNAIGTGPLTITGGTLDYTGGPGASSNNNLQYWNGDFTFLGTSSLNMGTGTVSLSSDRIVTVAANTFAVGGAIVGNHNLTVNGNGTLQIGNGAVDYPVNLASLTNNANVAYDLAGSMTLNAAYPYFGNGGLSEVGPGTLNIPIALTPSYLNVTGNGTMVISNTVTLSPNAQFGVGSMPATPAR